MSLVPTTADVYVAMQEMAKRTAVKSSVLYLQILAQVEEMVQQLLEVTTQVRIMTVKLHCPAVFNNGLCRTQVPSE